MNYKISDKIILREEDGAIYNTSNGKILMVNEFAVLVLSFIAKDISVNDIIVFLSNKYKIDSSQIENDLNDFINQMINKEVIKIN
jgi:hypothetical protein